MKFYTRRFVSGRCGYQFVKRHSSVIEKCPKCEEPCRDLDYKGSLDPYSEMKLYWYKYPKAHIDSIQHRQVVEHGDKQTIYQVDDAGRRIGELPSASVD